MFTRKIIVGMIVAVLVSMNMVCWGTTYYVDPSGSDDANGLSWEDAFATIQKGVDTAGNGDTVDVNEGTYYETVDFDGKAITVRSFDPIDFSVVSATIIDANSSGRVVTFDDGEDANSILMGFTITGGYANGSYPDYCGGGIYCYGASPTINRCIIIDNIAGVWGGGMYNYYGACPTVTNCIFANNSTIGNGQWGGYGGGICNLVNSSATLTNCTFSRNAAYIDNGNGGYGGAMLNHSSCTYITNCIFWDDYADNDGYEVYNISSDPNFGYCDIEGCGGSVNWDPNFGTDLGGNIDEDPNFVNADTNDFHLGPNSPCIDAGDPNSTYTGELDIDGEPRIMCGRVDMGADEFPRVHNITQNKWYVFIKDAIDDANYGNEIEVYKDTFYESVEIDVNSIILRGTDPNDWTVVADTIIDANNATYGIKYNYYLDSTLAGLTIRNASYYGIQCSTYSSPTIKNCIVEENDYGILGFLSSATIINSKIRQNTLCGIYILGVLAQQIKNNWIYDNARGIYVSGSSSDKVIRNNTIVGNPTAGIYKTSGTQPTVSNCIIWDNNSNDLVNCTATYSCIEDANDANGIGNITDDPFFVDDVNNNYHIEPNSPCIDAGDPNGTYTGELDIDFKDRLVGDEVDMGADEYDPNS